MKFESATLQQMYARDRLLIEEAHAFALGPGNPGVALHAIGGAMVQPAPPEGIRLEGIIHRILRPPLLVQDGTFKLPTHRIEGLGDLFDRLKAADTRTRIERAISRVGSLAILNVPGLGHLATGWVVRRDSETTATVVTNRHVAEHFAAADGMGGYSRFRMPSNRAYQIELDLKNEAGRSARLPFALEAVLYIAPKDAPDVALLRVQGQGLDATGLGVGETIALGPVEDEAWIGVLGYPSKDYAADPEVMEAYYEGTYDRKRFCWGQVMPHAKATEFAHDASTLWGNSGSMIFDLSSGVTVGLHYGWLAANPALGWGGQNFAVKASEVLAALQGLEPKKVHLGSVTPQVEVSKAGTFADRDGYDRNFLGVEMAPPKPGDRPEHRLAQAISDKDGQPTHELCYRHFSVWMSDTRLVPLMTAVNIDGGQAKRMGRGDWWFVDHRLAREKQIDGSGYKNNPLDRGHMVRREDPVWGDLEMAAEANRDSFAYTNAAPQHEALNQVHWRALEDYILGHARTRALKVSVFTGPVLAAEDPDYVSAEGQSPGFQIPLAFWKIACIIDAQTGKPSVTGYILSQGSLIRQMMNEFAYGGFMTYQVPLKVIAKATGLDLGHLLPHDPLESGKLVAESAIMALRGPGDITL